LVDLSLSRFVLTRFDGHSCPLVLHLFNRVRDQRCCLFSQVSNFIVSNIFVRIICMQVTVYFLRWASAPDLLGDFSPLVLLLLVGCLDLQLELLDLLQVVLD
jgi:hypothetical protein